MLEEEFTEFAAGATRPLLRLGWLLTYDREQAQDLAQTALVRTYAARRRVDSGTAHAYARRVLVNLHTDWLRRRPWREQSTDRLPETAVVGDAPGAADDRATLARALLALTRRERATVVLRYYLDLSEAETARTLGVSTGTVKSVSSRALRKLRDAPALHGLGPAPGLPAPAPALVGGARMRTQPVPRS